VCAVAFVVAIMVVVADSKLLVMVAVAVSAQLLHQLFLARCEDAHHIRLSVNSKLCILNIFYNNVYNVFYPIIMYTLC